MKYLLILSMIVCNTCYGQVETRALASYPPQSYSTTIYNLMIRDTIYQRKRDTILVFAMVIDTTHDFMAPYRTDSVSIEGDSIGLIYWVNGVKVKIIDMGLPEKLTPYGTLLYSVRELHNTSEGQIDPYACGNCVWHDYYKHLYYLDKNKLQLSKNTIVWQSKEIE